MQTYTWGNLKEKTGWVPFRLLFYKGEAVKGAASILKKKLPFSNFSFLYIPRGPCWITLRMNGCLNPL
ncbi:hypothetical protein N752_11250 [Desulforamulus aquiferis]|nr:hypothetical protein N752_11250 [Desulforamulus aquiferis]